MFTRRVVPVLVIAFAPVMVRGQVRIGPEFRVNSYTTGTQHFSRVASDPAGSFLVAWESDGQDGSGLGVFARWHDPDGVPFGAAEFRVNAVTANSQQDPAVAATPDGGMVVTWSSYAQDGSGLGVYARRYPSPLAAPGPEFLVNVYTTNNQGGPSLAVDGAGNFVVVWRGTGADDFGGIWGRRFDALGSPRGGDFRVNSYVTAIQTLPAVASDAAGNFVVVWNSSQQDGSGYGIFAQRYDAAGAPVGGEFRVNTYTSADQREPAVASDPDGNFVVAWMSPHDGSNDVWARRYDAAGLPHGDEFRVNVVTTGGQSGAMVSTDPNGGFVVVWYGDGIDGIGTGVAGRRYDASGTADPYEFALNSFATNAQTVPAVAIDAQGNFVTSWSSFGQDAMTGYGIFAQRFRPDLIFRDGFEDGTLGAWSSASIDGGDLFISPIAGLKFTTAGLLGVVDDTAGLYVQDDRPQDERRYRARFYFDPNGFDPGEAQAYRRTRLLLAFSETPTRRVAAIVLRRLAGEYSIRGRARLDDNTQADTPFLPITDEPHVIELDLRAASTPTSLDGSFVLSVDGVVASMMSLDNNLADVDFVRLGALSVKTGANGTMYWDEFESRRQGTIGP